MRRRLQERSARDAPITPTSFVDTLLISPPDKGCLLFVQKEQTNVQHFDTSLSQTPI